MAKSFFESYRPLLEFFKTNQIESTEEETRRYPKYIRDPTLFKFQIFEPFFRKSILIQLKLAYQIITNEEYDKLNKLNVKEGFLSGSKFSDSELQELKKFDESVGQLLKKFKITGTQPSTSSKGSKKSKNMHDVVSRTMRQEQQWVEWKNEGCKPFLREMDETLRKKFWDCGNLRNSEVTIQDKIRWFNNGQGNLLTADYKKMAELKTLTSSWYGTDKDYAHMDFLDKGNIFVSKC